VKPDPDPGDDLGALLWLYLVLLGFLLAMVLRFEEIYR
jgi:hypothetical protein